MRILDRGWLHSGHWMLTPIVVWPHPSVRAKYTSSRAESVRARHVKPAHLTPDCTQPQSNSGHWLAGLKDSVEPSWRWRELPRPPHTQHRGLSLNWTKFWIILIIDRFLEIGRQGGGVSGDGGDRGQEIGDTVLECQLCVQLAAPRHNWHNTPLTIKLASTSPGLVLCKGIQEYLQWQCVWLEQYIQHTFLVHYYNTSISQCNV